MTARGEGGCVTCQILSNGIREFLKDGNQNVKLEGVDELQIDFNLAGFSRSLEVALVNTDIRLSFFCSRCQFYACSNL